MNGAWYIFGIAFGYVFGLVIGYCVGRADRQKEEWK